MERGRRRPHRAAAAVGLLIGLVLLVGAVLDGGLATPSRSDLLDPAAAQPAGDGTVTRPAETREDRASWDLTPSLPPLPTVTWVGLLAAGTGAALMLRAGPRHRAPALLVARHRGPPPA